MMSSQSVIVSTHCLNPITVQSYLSEYQEICAETIHIVVQSAL